MRDDFYGAQGIVLYFGSPKDGSDHEDHWILHEVKYAVESGLFCLVYVSNDFPKDILAKHGYNREAKVMSAEDKFGAILRDDLQKFILSETAGGDFPRWTRSVENMRKLVMKVENTVNWDIRDGKYIPFELPRSFNLRFWPNGETSGMTFNVVPLNLGAALMLQCVSHRAAGAQIRACKSCGSLFEVGGDSGRRSHKEFCSDKCRFDFSHRNRRGKL